MASFWKDTTGFQLESQGYRTLTKEAEAILLADDLLALTRIWDDLGWHAHVIFLSWPKWLIQTWQNPKFLVFRLIYNFYTSVYICLQVSTWDRILIPFRAGGKPRCFLHWHRIGAPNHQCRLAHATGSLEDIHGSVSRVYTPNFPKMPINHWILRYRHLTFR